MPDEVRNALVAGLVRPVLEATAGIRPADQVESLVGPALGRALRRGEGRAHLRQIRAGFPLTARMVAMRGRIEVAAQVRTASRLEPVAVSLRTRAGRAVVTEIEVAGLDPARRVVLGTRHLPRLADGLGSAAAPSPSGASGPPRRSR